MPALWTRTSILNLKFFHPSAHSRTKNEDDVSSNKALTRSTESGIAEII